MAKVFAKSIFIKCASAISERLGGGVMGRGGGGRGGGGREGQKCPGTEGLLLHYFIKRPIHIISQTDKNPSH